MSPRHHAVIALVLLALGIGLRLYSLEAVPAFGETADEWAWAWAGQGIVQHGTPVSWSWSKSYPEASTQTVTWRGASYRLVRPWLDHPPLYAILVGTWLALWGEREPADARLFVMRLSSVLLFVPTLLLLAAVLRSEADPMLQPLTLLFYAVGPPAVLQGRLVVSENLLTAIFLAGFLLIGEKADRFPRARLCGVALGAAALPMAKLPALILCAALFLVAAIRRQPRMMAAVALGTALGIAADCLYAWRLDWGLFLKTMDAQRGRFSGFDGLYALLFSRKIVERMLFYPPFLLGLMAALMGFVKRVDLLLIVLVYAAGMTFMVDQRNVYSWYQIPLYPFLAIGTASFVIRMRDDWRSLGTGVWALFSITYLAKVVTDHHPEWHGPSRYFYLGGLVLAGLAMAWVRLRDGRQQRLLVAGLVGLQCCADVYYVLSAT